MISRPAGKEVLDVLVSRWLGLTPILKGKLRVESMELTMYGVNHKVP